MSELNLTIKCSNADKLTITCEKSNTVLDVKNIISTKLDVSAPNQRLIYKGRILKDESTLDQYEVNDGDTLHMVKSGGGTQKAATTSTVPTPNSVNSSACPCPTPSPVSNTNSATNNANSAGAAGLNPFMNHFGMGGIGGMDMNSMQQQMMQNPNMMQQMLNSPMMESFLSNPEIMSNMMLNNPQLQSMLDANPHVRHILSDPALMRQTLEMMRNPNAMREAMRTQDLAMSHLENHPEGFNALRRMYEEVQEPMMEATQNAAFNANSTNSAPSTSAPLSAPNTSALPNPWGAPAANANPWANMGAGANPINPWGAMGNTQSAANANPFGGANPFGAGGMGMGMDPMNMDPNTMRMMMQNPMIQQMMADPQVMQQVIASNPMLSQMAQNNPHMQQLIQNPQMLRQIMDPNNMAAMVQMQQAMRQLQSSGLMPAVPGMPGANPQFRAPQQTTFNGLDFSGLLAQPQQSQQPAFPTPQFNFPTPNAAPAVDPAVRFQPQLNMLENMGFTDRDANIRALTATNGNVNAAVDRLLGA